MCAAAITASWSDGSTAPRTLVILLTGAGVGLCGLLAFGTAHALLIVPIWTRLLGGAPFALAAGITFAWGFDVVATDARSSSTGKAGLKACTTTGVVQTFRSASIGALFGAAMAGALVPATIFKAVLRLTDASIGDMLETGVAIILALASGAAAGWLLARRRNPSLACAATSLTIMLASGGPLPLTQSARGAWLALAFLPICLVGGVLTAAVHAWFAPETI